MVGHLKLAEEFQHLLDSGVAAARQGGQDAHRLRGLAGRVKGGGLRKAVPAESATFVVQK
ncbi:MAG TPA: hypothetical protein VL326_25910 [Kofleriaceae bacterium]|nr:hypothetical protein [Kofleriaceae bacterium]